MKSLADYLLDFKSEFEYTVRVACNELSDRDMDRIENNLKEHELLDITKPKQTIMQLHPLGFAEPTKSEVWLFTVKLGMPASCFYLGREIAKILKLSEIFVVVNGIDNPLQELADVTPDPDYVSKVSTDPAYPEDKLMPKQEEMVGQKYVDNMLKTMMDAKKKDPDALIKNYSNKKK